MNAIALTSILTGLLLIAEVGSPDEPRKAEPKATASVQEPELRNELLARMKQDQDFRKRMTELMGKDGKGPDTKEFRDLLQKGQAIDHENTTWMKGVVDRHGWPGYRLVGKDGALAAFLLVQHADQDPAFQKKCLPLLADAVKQKEASSQHLAYLTDRVRLAQGQKQLYGTQLRQVDGQLQPAPIEDEAKVDERRKAIGLGSLADYVKFVRETTKPRAVALPGGRAAEEAAALKPPKGREVLRARAVGEQIYTCQAKAGSPGAYEWTFQAEAKLLDNDGKSVGRHFFDARGTPTWEWDDGSRVAGRVKERAPAPKSGDIPWLLLEATAHTGKGRLSGTYYIQRVGTRGGMAPAERPAKANEGKILRVPYQATYIFFAE